MSHPVALIVEDEQAQRAFLRQNIIAEGFHVLEAGNGGDKVLQTRESLPDLIVLYWMLPCTSGLEVCRCLKMRGEAKSLLLNMVSVKTKNWIGYRVWT